MPDITVCEGTGCPLKKKCYRYRYKDKGGPYQSFFSFIPYDKKNKHCDHFWG